jgi:hypothetical protein
VVAAGRCESHSTLRPLLGQAAENGGGGLVMIAVNILLFSSVVFVFVSLVLTLVHYRERQALERIRCEPAGLRFSALSIAQAFDPDHAILWETQVPALKLISSAGPDGIHIRRLYAWFGESAAHYPELYDGSGFKQWVEFLEEAELIACNVHRVILTPKGCEFLQYRVCAEPVGAKS